MTTLQEQFEKDFPDKGVRSIGNGGRFKSSELTNRDLDLREYENLTSLSLDNNLTSINLSNQKNLIYLNLNSSNLTSVDFLNQLPNPEKLEHLIIYNNNIQPTDISIFSKFVNLKMLKIGTMEIGLERGKNNKFYGSLKAYQNLTKLEVICIEATDVNEGLEYLPNSLTEATRGGMYHRIECSPHNTNAKCKAIQDQLRPFNYDIEA